MGRVAATESMPDFTDRTLDNGRYRLLRLLGLGAYGKVYRAADIEGSPGSDHLAVKCLNKPIPGSHTDLLQQREFANHRLVSGHPNIVTFHRFFTDDESVYVVMDLCNGGDLFTAITEKRIFHNNSGLIKRAFLQIIDAVQHCHARGVYHRDMKPENVLCSTDGKDIWLADFGLSTQSPVCRDFGCGSSYYMSPECIGRERISSHYSARHNDVWALGVILTNMITGRNPWKYAHSEDDCFSAYLNDNDFLKQVLPISTGVNTILKKIFTLNPLQRISLDDLRGAIVDLHEFYDYNFTRSSRKEPDSARGLKHKHRRKVLADGGVNRNPAGSSPATAPDDTPATEPANSDERYLFPSPVLDHPLHPPHCVHPQLLFPGDLNSSQSVDIVTVNVSDSDSNPLSVPPSEDPLSGQSSVPSRDSDSSGQESKGPITPATYPVEPTISVPDIPGGKGLGLGLAPFADFKDVILVAGQEPAPPKSTATNPKPRQPKQLFRIALQRIRALSSGNSSSS